MVGVIVSDEQVVDFVDAGGFGRGGDAAGIAMAHSGPAGIDEEGLPAG